VTTALGGTRSAVGGAMMEHEVIELVVAALE